MGKHRRPSHCVELSASTLSPLQTVIWFRKYPVFLKSGEGGGGSALCCQWIFEHETNQTACDTSDANELTCTRARQQPGDGAEHL